MASGWNLWVWLQCIGVASRCCYKEVYRRYIDILIIIINFPYSTCIRSFFGSSILTSLFIFKMFFRSYIYIIIQPQIYNTASIYKYSWRYNYVQPDIYISTAGEINIWLYFNIYISPAVFINLSLVLHNFDRSGAHIGKPVK